MNFLASARVARGHFPVFLLCCLNLLLLSAALLHALLEHALNFLASALGVVTPQIDLVRRCLGAKKSDNMGSYGVLTGADLKNVYLLSRFA